MNHVQLTNDERKSVLNFWGEWFRSGGQGDEPSAFQLDALNDRLVRDALLFWQVGGTPGDTPQSELREAGDWIEYLGNRPEAIKVILALTKVMANRSDQGVSKDDLDLVTVLILMHIEWMLIGGDFQAAGSRAIKLAEVTATHMSQDETLRPAHMDPLKAFSNAALTLDVNERMGLATRETLLAAVADLFGVPADDEQLSVIRASLERIKDKGGFPTWDLSPQNK